MDEEPTLDEPTLDMAEATRDVIVITGMSGAGRATAAKALEDTGWFVIDNMPASLIPRVVDLGLRDTTEGDRALGQHIAFGCDTREGAFFTELDAALHQLAERGIRVRMLFCEASDEVLLRRFEESRRPHPLAGDGRVIDGIQRERNVLAGLKERADLIVDTSDLNVHEFRDKVKAFFTIASGVAALRVSVVSFGFKHGAPRDVDLLFDVRFIPNPHWVPELRPHTGLEAPVRDYVLGMDQTVEFMAHCNALVGFLLPHYVAEGKSYLSIGVGCTGGRHRSVVLAEELGAYVRSLGYPVTVLHRDSRP